MHERVPTRVGLARFGDNDFVGHRVGEELAGTASFWTMTALALGAERLSPAACALLDDISVCTSAADARVWPLKIARLLASYGEVTTGLASALACAGGARVGPWPAALAAEQLCELTELLGDDTSTDALEPVLERWRGEGRRMAGYGVPLRERDERVEALTRCLARHAGRLEGVPGRHWALAHRVESVLCRERSLPMNIDAAVAALCLDLGFAPAQIGALNVILFLHNYLAHAVEGAEQQHPTMRTLPAECVRYVGAAPRTSPRAARAQTEASR